MPVQFAAPRDALRTGNLVPTAAGLRQILTSAEPLGSAPADSLAAWSRLPPVQSATALGSIKQTAEVFASTPSGEPLIAAITAGKGRSVAVGPGDTWRWCMESDDGSALHTRFWRQLVLWTANRRPSAYIRSDRPRYERAALRSARGKVRVEARIADPLTG